MDRRQFLRTTSAATVGGLVVRGFGSPLVDFLGDRSGEDRVLVIVQLIGGNDGLNTVVPLDQYSALGQVRPGVLMPESRILRLSGLNGTGLHPAMTGMRELWEEGKLAIVQGVGYPQPNFSHFRSTDIWETGANRDQVLQSGWTGRYLHQEYPNYPAGYPNADMPDPLAIRIDGPVGIGLQHMGTSMGVSINNTDNPLNLTGNIYQDALRPTCAGDKLGHVRTVQRQTDQYGNVINQAAQQGCSRSTLYPTGTTPSGRLGQALKIAAQLICGGLKTRIYWVSIGGFDTHANQVVDADRTTGTHATLLRGVSDSIHAFQDDLRLMGLQDRVLGMTFSEFGRRIISNASGGTDHGASQPMFLFGTKVVPGMLGTNPIIPTNATAQTNLPMQYDFRSVYASVLKDWFCLEDADVDAVMLDTYQRLNLVDPAGCIGADIHERNQLAGDELLEVYPNPFTERTTLRFTSAGGRVLVQVYNEQGQVVQTELNENLPPGTRTVDCDLGDLPSGIYYARMQNESRQQVKGMMKVR